MVIDHVGIAVKSIEEGVKLWERVFGYRPVTETVENTRQKVFVIFLEKDGSLPVKLIEPVDETSPIYAYARRGGGLHHLCFKCEELNTELDRLTGEGLRILAQPQPGEAFDNDLISFLYAGMGLNIEVLDTDKRAARLDL